VLKPAAGSKIELGFPALVSVVIAVFLDADEGGVGLHIGCMAGGIDPAGYYSFVTAV